MYKWWLRHKIWLWAKIARMMQNVWMRSAVRRDGYKLLLKRETEFKRDIL